MCGSARVMSSNESVPEAARLQEAQGAKTGAEEDEESDASDESDENDESEGDDDLAKALAMSLAE